MSWMQVIKEYEKMDSIDRAVWFGMLWAKINMAESYICNAGYINKNDLEILLGIKKPKDTETGDQ